MTLTRRTLLAAAAGAAFIGPARATEVDVAVVGAGAAGLAAAAELVRAGRRVVVLEARERIGGRVWTDASLGAPFDAGAQYIHWAESNPWTRIAAELGVEIREEPRGGAPAVFRDGVPVSEAERLRRRRAFGEIWSRLGISDGRDRSFQDAVAGADPAVAAAAAGITLFSLGEEPDRVSLADYEQLWAGDDYVVPAGYGTLVARSGAGLPIRLGTPVTAIRWDGPGVDLDTPQGVLRAAHAIVTVPVGVLRAEAIRFTPGLPRETLAALDGLGMGAYTKVALALDRSRTDPIPARDLIDIGTSGLLSIELWPFESDLAIATIGGDAARALCEAGEEAAVAHVTDRLVAMAGSHIRSAVRGGRLAGWWTDPYARGSYSVARPGRLAAREALRQPIGGRLHLAGEATAGGGAMTVGGATLEGRRAAAAVLRGRSG